ncbi:MAG TPA: hypothetical protein VEY67_05000, partial [Candidatus Dormibacteraeota bacterium]|nr:hypothetical protein [Candidatus Dormibacteraeota bacterium]
PAGHPEGWAEALRTWCEAVGRPFGDIRRSVIVELVIRDTEAGAVAAFDETLDLHDLRQQVGSDGSARGLGVGGPPAAVADFLRPYAGLGIDEIILTFRTPFDLETIRRIPEVRALLG